MGEQQTILALRPPTGSTKEKDQEPWCTLSVQIESILLHHPVETGRQRQGKRDTPGRVCILGRPGLVLPGHVLWSVHEQPAWQGPLLPGQVPS